ncbi:hypothetical protein ABTJ91_21025, partial [Acinetobacter baumannii]
LFGEAVTLFWLCRRRMTRARAVDRHVAARQTAKISKRRRYVTIPPFAAKFVTVSPYAGNGLLMNFEPFRP